LHAEKWITLFSLFKTKPKNEKKNLAPKLLKLSVLFFFFELAMKNWSMIMHFNPYIYYLRPFSWGGGAQNPPGHT